MSLLLLLLLLLLLSLFCEFFTQSLAGSLSLECEREKDSSGVQDSPHHPSRSQHFCGLYSLNPSSDFQFRQSLFQSQGDCS